MRSHTHEWTIEEESHGYALWTCDECGQATVTREAGLEVAEEVE